MEAKSDIESRLEVVEDWCAAFKNVIEGHSDNLIQIAEFLVQLKAHSTETIRVLDETIELSQEMNDKLIANIKVTLDLVERIGQLELKRGYN